MAFKMKGSPMQRNFGVGSPAKKGTKNEETGTIYQDGMAISDRKEASSEYSHSGIEVEAAKELGSGRVDRSQKRAQRKDAKQQKKVKFGSAKRAGRVKTRRRKKSAKASSRADKITNKRFSETEQGGQDRYNLIIERDNRERKERDAARAAANKT